jgi:hypothetical protein
VQVLVTADFQEHSPYRTFFVAGVGIHHIIQLLVILNLATTLPLLLLSLEDVLLSALYPDAGQLVPEATPAAATHDDHACAARGGWVDAARSPPFAFVPPRVRSRRRAASRHARELFRGTAPATEHSH